MIIANPTIDICRDKKDNKFLECADAVKADYIISGDDDLLSLKKYKDILVIRSPEALKIIS